MGPEVGGGGDDGALLTTFGSRINLNELIILSKDILKLLSGIIFFQ